MTERSESASEEVPHFASRSNLSQSGSPLNTTGPSHRKTGSSATASSRSRGISPTASKGGANPSMIEKSPPPLLQGPTHFSRTQPITRSSPLGEARPHSQGLGDGSSNGTNPPEMRGFPRHHHAIRAATKPTTVVNGAQPSRRSNGTTTDAHRSPHTPDTSETRPPLRPAPLPVQGPSSTNVTPLQLPHISTSAAPAPRSNRGWEVVTSDGNTAAPVELPPLPVCQEYMRRHLIPQLFNAMSLELLDRRPDDPSDFLLKWLKARKSTLIAQA